MNRKEFLKLTIWSSLGVLVNPLQRIANPFQIMIESTNVVFYNQKMKRIQF